MRLLGLSLISALLVAANLGCSPAGSNSGALSLIKKGDRYVGEQSKDKVVQIRSDQSVGSLTPSVWYVVYYDPDATFKATEVKFGAGQKLDVSRPWRMLEPLTGDNKVLDSSKFKVDSDRAIKIAAAEPLLKGLTLKATQLWLERGDTEPVVWRVRLWAAKIAHPDEMTNIGEVILSADTGKVVKVDLHVDRLN